MVAVAFASGALSAAYAVADALTQGGLPFFSQHNWTSTMLGNAVVLLATYVILDGVLDRRQQRRWREAIGPVAREFAARVGLEVYYIENLCAAEKLEPNRQPDAIHRFRQTNIGELELLYDVLRLSLVATPELVQLLPKCVLLWRDLRQRGTAIEQMGRLAFLGEPARQLEELGSSFAEDVALFFNLPLTESWPDFSSTEYPGHLIKRG